MAMALPVTHFTIDMLDDFPDDGNRYELLEGELIVTPQASFDHQLVAGQLARLLGNAVGSEAYVVAPGAIQRGNNTQLQPDVLVMARSGERKSNWRDFENWWLAVEVMSPSSRMYDRVVKRPAYIALGVQEYWLIDGRARSIEIFKRGLDTSTIATESVTWSPAALGRDVVLRLADIFED